jgi:hypothetical protein
LVRVTSLLLVLGTTTRGSPALVVDVELRVVDDDVDQGVPVGEADLQPLPGDLGRAAA